MIHSQRRTPAQDVESNPPDSQKNEARLPTPCGSRINVKNMLQFQRKLELKKVASYTSEMPEDPCGLAGMKFTDIAYQDEGLENKAIITRKILSVRSSGDVTFLEESLTENNNNREQQDTQSNFVKRVDFLNEGLP